MDIIKTIKGLLHEGDLTELKYYCLNNNISAEELEKNNSFDILTYAIEENAAIEVIDFVCSLYTTVNYELSNGLIPLYLAIDKGSFTVSDILLKNHADINFVNKNNDNLLFFLYKNNNLSQIKMKYLIKRNINVYFVDQREKNILYYLNDKNYKNVLDVVMNEYIYNNDFILDLITLGKKGVKISKKLLSNKISQRVDKFDLFSLSYYKKAIYWRNIDIVELFAKYCNKAFEYYLPLNGNDLLREAIMSQNECVVKYILKNDLYNFNELHDRNRVIENISMEPLVLAITVNSPTLVKYLIDAKFDVNIRVSDSVSALSFACIVNNLSIVKMLVKAGAKINKIYYYVELPIAARNGNFELVQFLLESYKKQQGYDKRLSVNSLKMKLKWNNYYHKNYQQQQQQQQQYVNRLNQQLQESHQHGLIRKNTHHLSYNDEKYQKQQKQIYMYGNCLYAAMYALTNGHREIYDYLMDFSDYYSKENLIYKVPMVIALSENNLKILEFLSKKGIPLNQTFNFKVSLSDNFIRKLSKFCNIQYNEEPMISLDNTSLLHYSVWKREYAIVQYLINNDVDINYQCQKGYTALMIATKNNDIRMVNLLVANGAKINIKDKEEMCPLIIACINGFVVLVKYLIDSGGDINVRTKFGENMLHLSYQLAIGNERFITEKYDQTYFNPRRDRSHNGSFEHMVNYLLVNHIDITVRDINQISPVDYAVVNNRVSDAKYFLINGANPNCQYNELDLLKYAILKNWLNMVRLLIKAGADIERKDKHSNTPLSCAVRVGSIDILKELVQAGVNLKSRDENGYTPLMYAVKRKSLAIINFLLSKGVDINERDNEGFNALMHAIAPPNNSMDVIQCLVDHGADFNASGVQQLSPLLLAARNNDFGVARYLVGKGAEINAKDSSGYNSLMYAVLSHNIPMIEFLIENGIAINERNCQEYTALMIASENGYINIVKYLVEHGADVSIKLKKNTTAKKLASKRKHFEVVHYLAAGITA